jgi:hypothetical protein
VVFVAEVGALRGGGVADEEGGEDFGAEDGWFGEVGRGGTSGVFIWVGASAGDCVLAMQKDDWALL